MRCLLYIRKKEPRHTATAFYIRRWIGEEGCGKGFLTRYIMTVVTVGPIVTACAGRRVALHLRCGLIYALHCTFLNSRFGDVMFCPREHFALTGKAVADTVAVGEGDELPFDALS